MNTVDEIRNNVAESIRAVAQQVIDNADDFAGGMEDATALRILLDFQINSLPTITVQKDISCGRTMVANQCRVWTRWSDAERGNVD